MKARLLILSIAVLCLSAAPAFADMYGTLDVAYKAFIRGYSQIDLAFYDGTSTNTSTENAVGLHLLDLGPLNSSSTDDPLPSDSYLVEGLVQAFCVDLSQGFPVPIAPDYNPYLYDAVSLDQPPVPGGPMGDTKAKYVAQLLNTNTYATALDAAVLQVAMWEVIYETDTTWDASAGTGFYLIGGTGSDEETIAGLANTMLSGLPEASSFSQYTSLSKYGKNLQDFVLVPVPAAVILGILGLGVAGLKLRKYA